MSYFDFSGSNLLQVQGAQPPSRAGTPFSFLGQLGKQPFSSLTPTPGGKSPMARSPVPPKSPDQLQLKKPTKPTSKPTTPVSSRPQSPTSMMSIPDNTLKLSKPATPIPKTPTPDIDVKTSVEEKQSRAATPDKVLSRTTTPDKTSRTTTPGIVLSPEKLMTSAEPSRAATPEKPTSRAASPEKPASRAATPEKPSSRTVTPDQTIADDSKSLKSEKSRAATPEKVLSRPTTPEERKTVTPKPVVTKTPTSSPVASPGSTSPEFRTPSQSPPKASSPTGDIGVDTVTFVDETSPKKEEVKERTPTPKPDDVAIARPVVPERTVEGMIPPPPSKQKSHAPPVPELKVSKKKAQCQTEEFFSPKKFFLFVYPSSVNEVKY